MAYGNTCVTVDSAVPIPALAEIQVALEAAVCR